MLTLRQQIKGFVPFSLIRTFGLMRRGRVAGNCCLLSNKWAGGGDNMFIDDLKATAIALGSPLVKGEVNDTQLILSILITKNIITKEELLQLDDILNVE
jgi:hypothetical protein